MALAGDGIRASRELAGRRVFPETARQSFKIVRVELRGFEPLTFCMPCRRATSCAIAPRCDGLRRSGTQIAYWLPNSDTYGPA